MSMITKETRFEHSRLKKIFEANLNEWLEIESDDETFGSVVYIGTVKKVDAHSITIEDSHEDENGSYSNLNRIHFNNIIEIIIN